MKPGIETKADLRSLLRRRHQTLSDLMEARSLHSIDALLVWCDANDVARPSEKLVREMLELFRPNIPVPPVVEPVVKPVVKEAPKPRAPAKKRRTSKKSTKSTNTL